MSQGQGQGVQPQAQAPQVGAAQPAPIPPAFALGPGRGNALLDYSSTSHIKHITRRLPHSNINSMANHPAYESS